MTSNEQLTRLRMALYRYGAHFDSCQRRPCSCGFLDEWRAADLPETVGEVIRIASLRPAAETGARNADNRPAVIQGVAVENGIAIVYGSPGYYGWLDEDAPEQHNCDGMGCGQLHVLARIKLETAAPANLGEQLTHGRNCSARFRDDGDCTCGLKWRIQIQTEQNLHAAWRKRAEEAEAALAARTAPETKARPRGKPCTCDNCLGSSVPCRVEVGERLGELWYCRKAAESQVKTNGDVP